MGTIRNHWEPLGTAGNQWERKQKSQLFGVQALTDFGVVFSSIFKNSTLPILPKWPNVPLRIADCGLRIPQYFGLFPTTYDLIPTPFLPVFRSLFGCQRTVRAHQDALYLNKRVHVCARKRERKTGVKSVTPGLAGR